MTLELVFSLDSLTYAAPIQLITLSYVGTPIRSSTSLTKASIAQSGSSKTTLLFMPIFIYNQVAE